MAKKNDRVHRLEDLLVEEVSIVDRPANQRRFLQVKSEDGMGAKGKEILRDADGNLVTDDKTPPTPEAPRELGIADVFKAVGEDFVEIEKRLTIDPEMRREIFMSLGQSMNRLHAVMGTADVANSDMKGEFTSKVVPLLAEELSEVAKEIGALSKRLNGSQKTKKNDDDPAPKPSEPTAEDALKALVEGLESTVEKRGAAMSKNRLAQFKQAIDMLAKILGEVDVQPAQKSAESDVVIKSVLSAVEKLTTVVRKQGKDLRTLREARGTSNAIPVEKSSSPQPTDDDVAWPLDMNDEKSRETVDKSTSFFDN